jgi:hypothetical protein
MVVTVVGGMVVTVVGGIVGGMVGGKTTGAIVPGEGDDGASGGAP